MNCPTCNITLLVSNRQGIELDYCPQCRGIWLDRGELDKIIARSAVAETKWHEYFSENAVPLFKFKREKYLSWRFVRYWRTKANLSRRIQI
jgi:Zn-finger nucleic acid-binding protein